MYRARLFWGQELGPFSEGFFYKGLRIKSTETREAAACKCTIGHLISTSVYIDDISAGIGDPPLLPLSICGVFLYLLVYFL